MNISTFLEILKNKKAPLFVLRCFLPSTVRLTGKNSNHFKTFYHLTPTKEGSKALKG